MVYLEQLSNSMVWLFQFHRYSKTYKPLQATAKQRRDKFDSCISIPHAILSVKATTQGSKRTMGDA